jgi:hypothetical protein
MDFAGPAPPGVLLSLPDPELLISPNSIFGVAIPERTRNAKYATSWESGRARVPQRLQGGDLMSKNKKQRREQRQERGAATREEQIPSTVEQATSTATETPSPAQKKRGRKFGHN